MLQATLPERDRYRYMSHMEGRHREGEQARVRARMTSLGAGVTRVAGWRSKAKAGQVSWQEGDRAYRHRWEKKSEREGKDLRLICAFLFP